MIEMDMAWSIILDKTRELAKMRAEPSTENTCTKDLDDIVPGDILAE